MEPAGRRSSWALAYALAAAVVLVATWHAYLVVVAGHVLVGWTVTAGLLVAAAGLLLSSRGEPSRGRAAAAVLAAVTSTGVLLAVGGQLLWGAEYRSLMPAGPTGCRVLVQETSFLVAGSGEVYVLRRGTGLARHLSSYTTDDGGKPVSAGGYTLTWDGGHGTLEVFDNPGNPVTPSTHTVGCG